MSLLLGYDTYGFARALACAGIRAGSLSAHGQSLCMAQAAVGFYCGEALQIAYHFAAKIALHLKLVLGDCIHNLVDMLLRKFVGAHGFGN